MIESETIIHIKVMATKAQHMDNVHYTALVVPRCVKRALVFTGQNQLIIMHA